MPRRLMPPSLPFSPYAFVDYFDAIFFFEFLSFFC